MRQAIAGPATTSRKPVPVFPETNDQIDIPIELCGVDLVADQPRFVLRDRKTSRARVTISPNDKPFALAYERKRSTSPSDSLTVKAILASWIGTSCFNRPAC